MRKELKETVTAVRNLEEMIGVKYKRSIAPSEAFSKMQQALRKQDDVKNVYQEVIKEAEQEAILLNARIKSQEEKLNTLLYGESSEV